MVAFSQLQSLAYWCVRRAFRGISASASALVQEAFGSLLEIAAARKAFIVRWLGTGLALTRISVRGHFRVVVEPAVMYLAPPRLYSGLPRPLVPLFLQRHVHSL